MRALFVIKTKVYIGNMDHVKEIVDIIKPLATSDKWELLRQISTMLQEESHEGDLGFVLTPEMEQEIMEDLRKIRSGEIEAIPLEEMDLYKEGVRKGWI